jgi:hypothetical protein
MLSLHRFNETPAWYIITNRDHADISELCGENWLRVGQAGKNVQMIIVFLQ